MLYNQKRFVRVVLVASILQRLEAFGSFTASCEAEIATIAAYEATIAEHEATIADLWGQLETARYEIDETSVDYIGADLSGCDFSGADLSYRDFTGANLSGADLSGAYLVYAGLSDANLSGADLSYADVTNTKLWTDFSEAILDGVDIDSAWLAPEDGASYISYGTFG